MCRDLPRPAALAVLPGGDRRGRRRLGRAGGRGPRRDGPHRGRGAGRIPDRRGPAADRGPLAGADQGRLLPRRPGALQRRRRPRPGAVGHRRARRTAPRSTRCSAARCATGSGSTAWVGGDEPGEIGEAVAAQVEAGFTAVKMNAVRAAGPGCRPPPRSTPSCARVAAVARGARRRTGTSRSTSTAGSAAPAPAGSCRQLAPLQPAVRRGAGAARARPHLLGDVVACLAGPDRHRRAAVLAAPTSCPRCRPASRVVQPDLSHAGGISEVRRIAALAETYGVASPRTARSARSRWPRACRSPSPRRTS